MPSQDLLRRKASLGSAEAWRLGGTGGQRHDGCGGVTGRTARRRVLRISLPADGRPGSRNGRADLLAAEEPLGIRIGGQALTLTMRTPGDDLDLAAGFLVSEGIVGSAGDVEQIRICPGDCGHPDHDGNVADVTLRPGRPGPAGPARSFLMTSACGVCGRSGIDDLIAAFRYDLTADAVTVTPEVLAGLPGALRAAQQVFSRTGGLHAAGLFTPDGTLLAVREDVGRHNAVDKVVGWALLADRLPATDLLLAVSGRVSFEIVQKAVAAGAAGIVAVSAPSSLAVDLARQYDLLLAGMVRGGRMNVYAGEQYLV